MRRRGAVEAAGQAGVVDGTERSAAKFSRPRPLELDGDVQPWLHFLDRGDDVVAQAMPWQRRLSPGEPTWPAADAPLVLATDIETAPARWSANIGRRPGAVIRRPRC